MATDGFAPWDNDIAADWMSLLMNQTKLPEIVFSTLSQEVNEVTALEIRVAASMLIMFGHPNLWPPETLDEHIMLAESQLKKCQDFEKDQEIFSLISQEIDALKALKTFDGPVIRDKISKIWKNWLEL